MLEARARGALGERACLIKFNCVGHKRINIKVASRQVSRGPSASRKHLPSQRRALGHLRVASASKLYENSIFEFDLRGAPASLRHLGTAQVVWATMHRLAAADVALSAIIWVGVRISNGYRDMGAHNR